MNKQYLMKVYPAGRGREVYRNIEICGDNTLNQLCQIILEAFDFIDEHLYEFCMDNRMYIVISLIRKGMSLRQT